MADAAGNHFGPIDLDANPEAEDYTESTYYRFTTETGVLAGGGLTTSGLTVTLAAINARVHGGFFWRDAPVALPSDPTAGANPRRDMLVLRSTLTSGSGPGAVGGKTLPMIVKGTPAATPVNPAAGDRDEILWSWQVAGSGAATISDVRDHRRAPAPKWARELPALVLPLRTGFTTEDATGYGTAMLEKAPWEHVLSSGIVRSPQVVGGQLAEANTLFGFTNAISPEFRPRGPRLLGSASTPSGVCDIYYTPTAIGTAVPFSLAYCFRENTMVYQADRNWFLDLEGLGYRR